MAGVELQNVSKVFTPRKNEEIYALTNLTLSIADGELIVMVGPSGCGKTTTLRLIAGLEKITAGTIFFDQIVMNEVLSQDRDVAMVFQRDALYPHMTVFENLAFGLSVRRVAKAEIETRVNATAAMAGLTPVLSRHPHQLSGGQRQRAAVARALVRNPKVLLLDEPLSHLDAPMRSQLRGEMARLHRQFGATTIYVTHDQGEAMSLGGRIVVLREGVVQQVAAPLTLYNDPANMFVAGFIGSPPMNLIRGHVVQQDGDFLFQENNPAGAVSGSRLELRLPAERGERLIRFAEGNVVLGIRPEHVVVRADDPTAFRLVVDAVEILGADAHVHGHTGAHIVIARTSNDVMCRAGDHLPVSIDVNKARFFNPASGAQIV
jgi:multiple sugar transport system ATP-binding protein